MLRKHVLRAWSRHTATVDEGMLERSGQGHVRASRPSAAEARVSNNGLHMQAVMCLRLSCNVELHEMLGLRGTLYSPTERRDTGSR
jgi:hypothetical protein